MFFVFLRLIGDEAAEAYLKCANCEVLSDGTQVGEYYLEASNMKKRTNKAGTNSSFPINQAIIDGIPLTYVKNHELDERLVLLADSLVVENETINQFD